MNTFTYDKWKIPSNIIEYNMEKNNHTIELTNDEMKSLCAHEFSHVVNGDINLSWLPPVLYVGKKMAIGIPIMLSIWKSRGRYLLYTGLNPIITQYGNYRNRQDEYRADITACKLFPESRAPLISAFTKFSNAGIKTQVEISGQYFSYGMMRCIINLHWMIFGHSHPSFENRIKNIELNT